MDNCEIEPFTGEMWAYLLNNALKFLTQEQRAGLCYDLYTRSDIQGIIDRNIELYKLTNENNE
jgi:hypothetical protein